MTSGRVLAVGALMTSIWTTHLAAQQSAMTFEGTFTKRVASQYLLYLPKTYTTDTTRRWPLIIFLHGSGERGNDLELVKRHGPPKLAAEGKAFEFLIVSPQCRDLEDWSNDVLISLLDDLIARYRVDPSRVYLTGLSMGGWGVWNLAIEYPHRFAAIAPVCARVERNNPGKACRLKDVPVWVFHGALDPIVPITESGRMVTELRKCSANVRFTVYPEAGHDAWTDTYNNAELYQWFLAHSTSLRTADPRE